MVQYLLMGIKPKDAVFLKKKRSSFFILKTYQRKRLNFGYFIKMLESCPKIYSIFAKFTL